MFSRPTPACQPAPPDWAAGAAATLPISVPTVTVANKLRLLAFAVGDATSPGLEITGDAAALPSLVAVLDQPDPDFNIITP